MALVITLSYVQEDSCGTLAITDATGAYDGSSNPNGWKTSTSGGSNLQIDNSSITTAYFEITPPDGDAIVIDLTDTTIWQAITPYTTGSPFDSSTNPDTLAYDITEDILGTTFIDGIWNIKLVVSDGVNTTTYTKKIALYCNIECCIRQLTSVIPEHYECDKCTNSYLSNVVTLKGMLEALKDAACLANVTRFDNILESTQALCEIMGKSCS